MELTNGNSTASVLPGLPQLSNGSVVALYYRQGVNLSHMKTQLNKLRKSIYPDPPGTDDINYKIETKWCEGQIPPMSVLNSFMTKIVDGAMLGQTHPGHRYVVGYLILPYHPARLSLLPATHSFVVSETHSHYVFESLDPKQTPTLVAKSTDDVSTKEPLTVTIDVKANRPHIGATTVSAIIALALKHALPDKEVLVNSIDGDYLAQANAKLGGAGYMLTGDWTIHTDRLMINDTAGQPIMDANRQHIRQFVQPPVDTAGRGFGRHHAQVNYDAAFGGGYGRPVSHRSPSELGNFSMFAIITGDRTAQAEMAKYRALTRARIGEGSWPHVKSLLRGALGTYLSTEFPSPVENGAYSNSARQVDDAAYSNLAKRVLDHLFPELGQMSPTSLTIPKLFKALVGVVPEQATDRDYARLAEMELIVSDAAKWLSEVEQAQLASIQVMYSITRPYRFGL